VPRAQHRLGGAQVDLGLAAARDAVQQDRLAAVRSWRGICDSAASCSGSSVGGDSPAPLRRPSCPAHAQHIVGQQPSETRGRWSPVRRRNVVSSDGAVATRVVERRSLTSAEPDRASLARGEQSRSGRRGRHVAADMRRPASRAAARTRGRRRRAKPRPT